MSGAKSVGGPMSVGQTEAATKPSIDMLAPAIRSQHRRRKRGTQHLFRKASNCSAQIPVKLKPDLAITPLDPGPLACRRRQTIQGCTRDRKGARRKLLRWSLRESPARKREGWDREAGGAQQQRGSGRSRRRAIARGEGGRGEGERRREGGEDEEREREGGRGGRRGKVGGSGGETRSRRMEQKEGREVEGEVAGMDCGMG
eukprot:2291561-Rhodomonas_salina.1